MCKQLFGFIAVIGLACVPVQGWAQDEGRDDDEFAPPAAMEYFLEVAEGVIDEKCTCPDVENAIPAYARCLEKQSKKAADAFKKALRFSGESFKEFRTALTSDLDGFVEDCRASFDEDGGGDDGDDFPPDGEEDFS